MSMESFTGVSPVFTMRGGSLQYVLQPYFGENKHDDGENRKLLGVKARMSGDGFEALVNYSSAKLELDPTSSRFAETNDKGTQVWNVGASLDRDNMLVMAEYGKSRVDNTPDFDTTAGYATLGYHFGRYLPSLTYAFFDQDSGLGQKSIALTVRRELTSFSAVKVQLKSIDPDQRRTALAGGEQPSGLFEASPAEERVRILSLSLNLVF